VVEVEEGVYPGVSRLGGEHVISRKVGGKKVYISYSDSNHGDEGKLFLVLAMLVPGVGWGLTLLVLEGLTLAAWQKHPLRVIHVFASILLVIDDFFDQLQGSHYFSKIDLQSSCHQLRVHEEDFSKTAFRMRYGHFNFTVMRFVLTNAPAVFMNLINQVCKPYLDKFVIRFIDDILIYSKSKEDYEVHLKLVLELLKKEKLFAKFSKCEFWLEEVRFLRHVVNSNDIHVESSKIELMKNLKVPKTPSKIRSFLGLAGYYWRFIVNFSKISKPLTSLTQKDQKSEDFVVYYEASNQGLACVLMQRRKTLQKALETQLDIIVAYHPQTDGQTLYGRKCRSPVLWAEIGESRLIIPELVQETTDKVLLIKKGSRRLEIIKRAMLTIEISR
nr:putative reverse transcriptase domain-containing protein [Tanacetum cinerariifolium]